MAETVEEFKSLDTDQEKLVSRLDDLPDGLLSRIRGGFRKLGNIDDVKRTQIAHIVVDQLRQGSAPRNSEIVEKIGVSAADASDMSLAISVTFGMLVDLNASATIFVEATEGKLFAKDDIAVAEAMAERIVLDRPVLKQSVDDSSIATAVLPSLVSFDVEVDLRVRFKGDEMLRGVPVAVVHIDSDCRGQEMWLQLKRVEVEDIIEKLKRTALQMDAAAKLATSIKP